jgi:hypothetical protein
MARPMALRLGGYLQEEHRERLRQGSVKIHQEI